MVGKGSAKGEAAGRQGRRREGRRRGREEVASLLLLNAHGGDGRQRRYKRLEIERRSCRNERGRQRNHAIHCVNTRAVSCSASRVPRPTSADLPSQMSSSSSWHRRASSAHGSAAAATLSARCSPCDGDSTSTAFATCCATGTCGCGETSCCGCTHCS